MKTYQQKLDPSQMEYIYFKFHIVLGHLSYSVSKHEFFCIFTQTISTEITTKESPQLTETISSDECSFIVSHFKTGMVRDFEACVLS